MSKEMPREIWAHNTDYTAMRKAVDGDGSGEIWKLMGKMETENIVAINDFMVACVFGLSSPIYKEVNKKLYPPRKK